MKTINYVEMLDRYEAEWDLLFGNGKFRLRHCRDPYLDSISNFLVQNRIKRILSVPCGDGINEHYLSRKGFMLDCVDISSEAIKKFKRRMGQRAGVHVYKHDAFVISEEFQNAEAIISMDFIFHIAPRLHDFLSEAKRSLRKGGILIFNFYAPTDDTYGKGEKIGEKTFRVIPNILIKYFTLPMIKRALKASGLTFINAIKYERKDKKHIGFRYEKSDYHTHRGYLVYCSR